MKIAALLLIAISTARARTITVTSAADDGPGSLRQALSAASNGDTINIVANGTITLTSGELVVNKSVTISGPGLHGVISGNNISRVFHVTPGTTVTLDSLTITDGRVSDQTRDNFPANAGGGIYNDHACLTVTNCVVTGNSAVLGAGIFSNSNGGDSANLTLNNTTVINNSAQSSDHRASYGGGIFSGGGFLSTGPSGKATLTVNRSTISSNTAELLGGGIFNDGFAASAILVMNDSTISGNDAFHPFSVDQSGGGIYNNGDSGIATAMLTNCTLTANHAGASGGAIYNDGTNSISIGTARVSLKNCAVTKNSAHIDDVLGGVGGGIFSIGLQGISTVTLTHCTFTENSAGFGDGGAVWVQNYPDDVNSPTALVITDCAIKYNTAADVGSGIGIVSTKVVIANTIISGNEGGCAITIDAALGNPSSSRVELNNCTINNTRGGGICNSGVELRIVNSTISGNTGGGGILNEGSTRSPTAVIENSTVSGNSSTQGAGGIFNGGANFGYVGTGATLLLINSTVSGNSGRFGGGIWNEGFGVSDDFVGTGTVIIKNSTISGNSADLGGGILSYDFPGAFGISTVDITNSIVNAGSSGENLVAFEDGIITSHGYNLSSDAAGGDNTTGPGGLLNGPGDIRNTNPLLGPLKDNGGPTLTHTLLDHSPTINAGDPNFNPYAFDPPLLYDQRGPNFPRIVGGRIDIGAVESRHGR